MLRIAFVSPMCLLDQGSGAAISVHTWLKWLAEAGADAHAITLSLFDRTSEYPFDREVGPAITVAGNVGKVLKVRREGVQHHIFYTRSTLGSNLNLGEAEAFLGYAQATLENLQPDAVVSYGSSEYARQLQELARSRCRRFVFYLANAEFRDPSLFASTDRVVCPSQFLADYYRHTLGLEPAVIPNEIAYSHFLAPGEGSIADHPEARELGLVTLINPSPAKGLTLFWQLVRLAGRERPELTFLAVEGRMESDQLRALEVGLDAEPNVWVLPNQGNMRRVYARTSTLLVPSFGQEAAARVIAEGQLSGIPVLAANRGGISEQLNGGGILFDIPARCTTNYGAVPTSEEVAPWLETICRLRDDEGVFREVSERARLAGAAFHPDRRRAEVLRFFAALAGQGG